MVDVLPKEKIHEQELGVVGVVTANCSLYFTSNRKWMSWILKISEIPEQILSIFFAFSRWGSSCRIRSEAYHRPCHFGASFVLYHQFRRSGFQESSQDPSSYSYSPDSPLLGLRFLFEVSPLLVDVLYRLSF